MEQQQRQEAGTVAIVGRQYCFPHSKEYVIKKIFSFSGGDYNVTDTHGNLFFNVEGRYFSLTRKRLLLDASGRPLLSLKRKVYSMHDTWQAFLGDSISNGQQLFTLKKSSVFQFKTSLDVFLAHNNTGVPDFNIKGKSRATIYHHNQVVAQVKRKRSVYVYPGIDSAFIISLVVIMDELQQIKRA
ncbi:hypothetical protein O6H91_01G028000 [Diphasiastrum complanatum]|uniref:Uncharacterized protein n=1 Tax=Diphasiastrum complanatum TaxID=34168 RepID=A0ACC2EPB7_DIPCM|nr:hypothetical protein O6H91_01G028000 [Diphasiastrum complanatum]